jgi:hypothetical protein
MSILTRPVLTSVLLLLLFSTAYPASIDKTDPIAQVCEVQGKATVKSPADGSIAKIKKGSLLGRDDTLILDRTASISVYFKNGGRKEIQAKDTQISYKVEDLFPHAQAYSRNVPMFGATRGLDSPAAHPDQTGFFYPQEAVILDSQPLIEFTLFNGSEEAVALGGALVQIMRGSMVLDSRKFNSLEYGSPYVYEPAKLEGQTEYRVELRLELRQGPGNVSISFPLYVAGSPDTSSASKYAPLSDQVYRSVESASIDYKGQKRTITLIKQIVRRSGTPAPVMVIELFIP